MSAGSYAPKKALSERFREEAWAALQARGATETARYETTYISTNGRTIAFDAVDFRVSVDIRRWVDGTIYEDWVHIKLQGAWDRKKAATMNLGVSLSGKLNTHAWDDDMLLDLPERVAENLDRLLTAAPELALPN